MRRQPRLLVAYSGGVDSTYLSAVAHTEPAVELVCVTGVSPSVSADQLEEAKRQAFEIGFRHELVETGETEKPEYIKNAPDRCFHCKTELYAKLNEFSERETKGAVIVDGTNADDLSDFRPGVAAAEKAGVVSPLAMFGFSKEEVRSASRQLGISGWEKPSSPCLSSRIAYGVPVTIERLARIEKGESILRSLGFREFRLRSHKNMARIEISKLEMERPTFLLEIMRVTSQIKELGYDHVTLDLEGFKSGSLNRSIAAPKNG